MDLDQLLEDLKRRFGDPPPAPSGPAQLGGIRVRPASRVEEIGRVPAETAEAHAAAFRRANGMPPPVSETVGSMPAEDAEREASRWRRENLSNDELIRRANEGLALSRSASSPNANLSDEELDAKVQETLGPKHMWRMPSPTPEGTAQYGDLLAAAKKATGAAAPEQDWEGSWGYHGSGPLPVKIESRTPAPAVAATSPEKKAQTAPGGGALGADPKKAMMEMALGAIPNPDVRALMAKRLGLAMDGDTELRAAQQKEERLNSMAGLQRQLGQAASILGGDKYDDTAAAGAERSAGIGTRGVMAQRGQQDKNAQGAMDISAQLERERAARAGEGLDTRRIGESERHNREGEKIDWYQARTQREKASKEGASYDKEVQKLAKEMGGEVALGAQKLKEIDAALRTQGIKGIDDSGTKVDLQGAGPVTNLATKLTGNTFISQKGANLRNSTLGLAATIKYLRTGKTATQQEAAEIAQEFGMAPGSSETDFRQGIQRMRDEFVARARQKGAGFSDRAMDTFERRGGTTADTLGQIGRVQSASDYAKLPPGAEYVGPDGQKRRKR